MTLFSFFHDLFSLATLKLVWGPSTDPNKLAPPMAQYSAAPEWPSWCKVSSHGANIIKVTFLDILPDVMQGRHDISILNCVENIRLQQLSHYKSGNAWNHEFIKADLIDMESKKKLAMVWERDLPLIDPRKKKYRAVEIKSGLPCESIDRITLIKETDFTSFVNEKQAYVVRYVDSTLRCPFPFT